MSKTETITGYLLFQNNSWSVQSGYGTFPLSEELQSKPDAICAGARVSAKVEHKTVVRYNFVNDSIDT